MENLIPVPEVFADILIELSDEEIHLLRKREDLAYLIDRTFRIPGFTNNFYRHRFEKILGVSYEDYHEDNNGIVRNWKNIYQDILKQKKDFEYIKSGSIDTFNFFYDIGVYAPRTKKMILSLAIEGNNEELFRYLINDPEYEALLGDVLGNAILAGNKKIINEIIDRLPFNSKAFQFALTTAANQKDFETLEAISKKLTTKENLEKAGSFCLARFRNGYCKYDTELVEFLDKHYNVKTKPPTMGQINDALGIGDQHSAKIMLEDDRFIAFVNVEEIKFFMRYANIANILLYAKKLQEQKPKMDAIRYLLNRALEHKRYREFGQLLSYPIAKKYLFSNAIMDDVRRYADPLNVLYLEDVINKLRT